MAQAAVSDVAGQWLLAGRSEKTIAGGSSIRYVLIQYLDESSLGVKVHPSERMCRSQRIVRMMRFTEGRHMYKWIGHSGILD